MLLRYGAANHLSVRDYQEISCAASRLKDDARHLIKISSGSIHGDFLPVIALYGANAAGKSNVVDALCFMIWTIENSYKNSRDRKTIVTRSCKLFADGDSHPSVYDCDVLIGDIRYHYGFECTEDGFAREFLYSFPKGSKTLLFERDFTAPVEQIHFGASVRGIDPTLVDLAENRKALFLSLIRQTQHELFRPIYDFFVDHFFILRSTPTPFVDEATAEGLDDPQIKSTVENVLRQADFGIDSLEVEETAVPEDAKKFRKEMSKLLADFTRSEDQSFDSPDTQKNVIFVHRCGDHVFKLNAGEESTGTIHLLQLLVPTIVSLRKGRTLIIDEITTTLHTKLSEELIGLFTDPATNGTRAQFLFTTHDTNLLANTILRRDEIWFTEKTEDLSTRVFPLTDFRTRKDDNLERGYLQGRFGAVPSFGDLTRAVAPRRQKLAPPGDE